MQNMQGQVCHKSHGNQIPEAQQQTTLDPRCFFKKQGIKQTFRSRQEQEKVEDRTRKVDLVCQFVIHIVYDHI